MLEKDFYDNVEIPGYLKNILYGDSVTGEMNTFIKYDGFTQIIKITFNDLWNKLIKNHTVKIIGDKEYIFYPKIKTCVFSSIDNWLLIEAPDYLMRHKINKEIYKLETKETYLEVTKDHSLLEWKDSINNFEITLACKIKTLPNIENFNFKSIPIINKEVFNYDGYVYDFCCPKNNNFTANGFLVHNTDSLFLSVPHKDSLTMTTEEKMKFIDKVAEDINDIIKKYLNEYYLPKSNINPDYNTTYFKSEMLMESIMLLDVKKNYAYKILAKKGKIFKEPKISYTGIQVVKSDASPMTQCLLKELIENVSLNSNIINQKERIKSITDIINKYYTKFHFMCDNLEINFISFPGKWSKKIMFINGMQLFNFIMNKEIFGQGSSANFIYCSFKNPKIFNGSGLDMSKVNGICIPHKYEKEEVKKKFEEYQICIDKDTQWEKLNTTTVQRVMALLKD